MVMLTVYYSNMNQHVIFACRLFLITYRNKTKTHCPEILIHIHLIFLSNYVKHMEQSQMYQLMSAEPFIVLFTSKP